MKREHILVIRFSALGDVAMMVPVVHAVAMRYPDVRITVLSRPFARILFDDLAPNVNFMAADVNNDYHGVKGLNRLYRRLAAKQFTAVADLHAVLRSNYLRMRFKLGRYRVAHIDKHRHQRHQLVAKAGHKVLQQLPTPFENYSDVFARLGYPIGEISFRSIFENPEQTGHAHPTGNLNLLPKAIGPKRSWEHWIGIAPFASYEGKIYPPEKMEQVLEGIANAYPKARIFLFGRGHQEEDTFAQWTEKHKMCLNVSEHVQNMYQELILMSHLDVMLSMDSANMHLASLTDTPVVSIWGATHPLAGFMGWRQQQSNAIGLDMDCRPCSIYGKNPCMRGDYQCMRGISVQTVIDKIKEVISGKE